MTEYRVPSRPSKTEFTEKRSTFIGHVFPVETEEEARGRIGEMKKKYHDARHNCWCYLIKDGAVRYSDDGEPQGTAGQPMLNVFQKEGVANAVCVVTRYFGGILLGAGGLTRAYGGTAKLALESGQHPAALKDAVCSPGGTTIQGVRILEERGFRAAAMDAVIAAYEKTLKLR